MNMHQETETPTRRYRMTARAEATAATRARILDAAIALFWEESLLDLPLEEVAKRAEVSLPTVIRHFTDRQTLMAAAGEREFQRISAQRDAAPAGDLRAAIRNLFDHYEEMGDAVIRLLAEETRIPALRTIGDQGRAYHAGWCERVFASALAGTWGDVRARRLAECIAITDVFVWKLLRRDRGLTRSEAELAVHELLEPIIGDR